MQDHIITPLGKRAFGMSFKRFISKEKPKLLTLNEHHNVVLFGVYGDENNRDRLVGYCLLFGGAPIIHHYTRYVSLSYSEPTDIRTRQMRVLFDDQYVRLTRVGVGVFDYLWICRKNVPQQLEVDVADHAAHTRFKRAWRDGM